jgi:hypothetical protein
MMMDKKISANKNCIDMHIHSTFSDGKLTPKQIVDEAISKGMKAIAITDHDSIDGVKQALAYAEKMKKVIVVPGVEISCYEPEMGYNEVHVLGFFFNPEAKPINELLKKSKNERINQKKKIIKNLNKIGFKITFKEVLDVSKGEVGRPHVAEVLVRKYPGEFSSISDVFRKYIRNGGPAYAERDYLTSIKEAADAIIKSGGVAVLAHPAVFRKEDIPELVDYFIKCNGKGIETYYPYAKLYADGGFDRKKEKQAIAMLQKIACEKGLFESGGSDFHGGDRKTAINEMKIPCSLLDKMKESFKEK